VSHKWEFQGFGSHNKINIIIEQFQNDMNINGEVNILIFVKF